MAITKYGHRVVDDKVWIANERRDHKLGVSFRRTIRVPDNQQPSHLPPDLGKFPLSKVSDYEQELPAAVVTKGGLFFPMHRKNSFPSLTFTYHLASK